MEKRYLLDIIEGPNINLQKQKMENASLMFDYVDKDRERLKRFLPWPDFVKTVDDEKGFIEKCLKEWENHEAAAYALFRNDTDEYMGNITAFDLNWDHESCEIGYWILGDFEGKGYMSEAVSLLESTLFEVGFHRIIIRCDPQNERSKNIPRKLGYHYEGTLRDCHKEKRGYVSLEVYSRLSSDW
jgi:RimJ/RimL family protein N-acetyltransferase